MPANALFVNCVVDIVVAEHLIDRDVQQSNFPNTKLAHNSQSLQSQKNS